LQILEERCLGDRAFAETHERICLPIIEAFEGQGGAVRGIAGERVRAFAAMTPSGGMGGGMIGGGSSGGFHPADLDKGGGSIGHETGLGGGIRDFGDRGFPGGPGRGGFDPIRGNPGRFRVFGDRIFDIGIGDFLPFSYYEYQYVLGLNPLLLCEFYPQLCVPQGRAPFLEGPGLYPAGQLQSFDLPEIGHRQSWAMGHGPRKQMMNAMGQPMQMGPMGAMGAPVLLPNVATSDTDTQMFMNPLATTSSGAVLPVIPQAPMIDPTITPTAMTAMYAGAYPATAGTDAPADNDIYANIGADRRGSILSPGGNPSTNLRSNIMMSNYF
jgi:hypothetical protein